MAESSMKRSQTRHQKTLFFKSTPRKTLRQVSHATHQLSPFVKSHQNAFVSPPCFPFMLDCTMLRMRVRDTNKTEEYDCREAFSFPFCLVSSRILFKIHLRRKRNANVPIHMQKNTPTHYDIRLRRMCMNSLANVWYVLLSYSRGHWVCGMRLTLQHWHLRSVGW